jgi:hypothetical protein
MHLADKSVVLICPDFFNYKDVIENGLTKKFSNVITFADRPKSSSVSKAIIKFNILGLRSLFSRQYSEYIFKKLEPKSQLISTIFIVKGTCIDIKLINELKACNPDIRVVIYTWDSIVNAQSFLNLAKVADQVISFDMNDCLSYNFKYVSLFSQVDSTKNAPINKDTINYHFYFIGSYHSDRIGVLKKLYKSCEDNAFVRVFFQSKLQFAFYWLLDKNLRKAPQGWITFTALTRESIDDIAQQSRYVVDIHHDAQYGITMRSWEVISSGQLLITTNPNILYHINDDSIKVIDRNSGLEWSAIKRKNFLDNNLSTAKLINDNYLVHTIDLWLEQVLSK